MDFLGDDFWAFRHLRPEFPGKSAFLLPALADRERLGPLLKGRSYLFSLDLDNRLLNRVADEHLNL